MAIAIALTFGAHADWPMLRGNPQHDGFTEFRATPQRDRAWAVEFENERLGTVMEPIVADGRVFVATHAGRLYSLDARSGAPQWCFAAHGPFLHSPAFAGGLVYAASTDGWLYGLRATSGEMVWRAELGRGGAAASPVVADGLVFLGDRQGGLGAWDAATGARRWHRQLGAPIRQTAAVADGCVFVTTEELRTVALDARTGAEVWRSAPLAGQSARDYYPVVVTVAGRPRVFIRTNPAHPMAERIARDRTLLCRNAGADDRDWKTLDAWLKSDAAQGTPELWQREQTAVAQFLADHPTARTFFAFDGKTGRAADAPPILWAAGCQGVGAPPALCRDGRLLVFHRSAYGNWNLGVAPLVSLGLFDPSQNRIQPLFHARGPQPPWNTFWGTADESQNFVMAGDTALMVHQGTLSGFDLLTGNLFTIHGERDTYGGLRNPPWARNEWHGPGRGGVALSGDRIYWLTGSRVLCLGPDRMETAQDVRRVRAAALPVRHAPAAEPRSTDELGAELSRAVQEVLSARWAPLLVEPGLAGREFFFADTASLFEALAWAFPHLPMNERETARAVLASEFASRPPYAETAALGLADGRRREWAPPPPDTIRPAANDPRLHPFAGVYAARFYGERCNERERVLAQYPAISNCFRSFVASGWSLDGGKGDLHANRYLRSLLAMIELARAAGDATSAEQAERLAERHLAELARWWRRVAAEGTLQTFNTTAELDPFIGKGDGLSFRLAPHRHKVALLLGLSPELAGRLRALAGAEVQQVWRIFERLYATWWIVGEERQVHFGENYVDPPDLAAGGFGALAWLLEAAPEFLRARIDLPFCRADLFHVQKLAMALDAARRHPAGRLPAATVP